MIRRLLLQLLVLVAIATPAASQVTIPYSFTFETTIDQDQVNSNFTTLGNAALNRTGGTVTGAVTSAGGSLTGSWAGSPTFTANPTFSGTPVFSNAVTMSGTTTYSGTLTSSGGTISGSWAGTPTFSAAVVFSGNPSFTGTPTFSNAEAIKFTQTGLTIASSTAANALTIKPNEALTAGRTFNIVTGDADRTVTLSGSPTLNDWFDQSVKQAASPTFAGLTSTSTTTLANSAFALNATTKAATFGGSLTTKFISVALDANSNDYSPVGWNDASATAASIELSGSTATRTITGLAGGSPGRTVWFINRSANTYNFTSEDAASAAANRFRGPIATTAMRTDGGVMAVYDGSRWQLITP